MKALGGDVRITMYRQKLRIICKSRDDGLFRRGQIGGEKEVEQGANITALGKARIQFVAKPSQAKVLTGGGDLREAQVDVPLSASHSCV